MLIDDLKATARYDPETGFFYRVAKCRGEHIGVRMGGMDNYGYRHISILGTRYRAHHLVWLLYTGALPTGHIDHVNGIKDDNRFSNLRQVDRCGNLQNIRKAYRNNKSGLLGASWSKQKGRWVSQITVGRRHHYLGSFVTPEEAHQAYITAKRKLHLTCSI